MNSVEFTLWPEQKSEVLCFYFMHSDFNSSGEGCVRLKFGDSFFFSFFFYEMFFLVFFVLVCA